MRCLPRARTYVRARGISIRAAAPPESGPAPVEPLAGEGVYVPAVPFSIIGGTAFETPARSPASVESLAGAGIYSVVTEAVVRSGQARGRSPSRALIK
jgi:hypothetical protein